MLLLLLHYIVLRTLWKLDVYPISTLVNKSIHYAIPSFHKIAMVSLD